MIARIRRDAMPGAILELCMGRWDPIWLLACDDAPRGVRVVFAAGPDFAWRGGRVWVRPHPDGDRGHTKPVG